MTGCILAILLSSGSLSNPPGVPLSGPASRDLLQYDDGTAFWLTWGGLYRGVWFSAGDFCPGASGFSIGSIEFWFYNTPDPVPFVARLVEGYFDGAVLDEETLMSSQGTWTFDPPIQVGPMWSVTIDAAGSGDQLSLLGDNTPNSEFGSHSFFSDDYAIWEPWILQGPEANDYFIRVYGDPVLGLEESTWGGLKPLFWR